ncbi:protein SCAF11 isoform X2 [Spea bombifrons]|uniref:protein SCAF11 isoform X2 n=1 Tax=Spea bombifrons TaxID=233779 RepID=UPI00234A549C|nr:protein SCAF11 isoform X2 [Spea bombifrons]
MKNNPSYTSGANDQESDNEENNKWTSVAALCSSERCPICLNVLTQDVGFPETCYHAFCLTCILKWSETSTSCPVDRKPFQVVCKINPAGGSTKIHVKPRRPRSKCCCNDNLWHSFCCAKAKTWCRSDTNKDSASQNFQSNKYETKRCIVHEEKQLLDLELKKLSLPNRCFSSDFVNLCPLNQSGLPLCANNSEFSEDSEIHLVRQKNEGLKHLRPTVLSRRSECMMSLTAETETETLLSLPATFRLDNFMSISTRNKGFLKRTYVNSSAQEGTEKKAASGASNRGTRKKTVQSTTRRRSTRNSKSEDTSQLPASPKSSSSDHDAPGHNSGSLNVSPSEQPGKKPPKQTKRSKKGTQVRKRLKPAKQTQEQSNESSESEEELEKDKVFVKNSTETASSDIETSPTHYVDSAEQRSSSGSPFQIKSDGELSAPMDGELSDEKLSKSPLSQNDSESDLEDTSTFPVLNNAHSLKVANSLLPTASEDQLVDVLPQSKIVKSHLESDEGDCSDSKSHLYETGNSTSPVPEKHHNSDCLDSTLSPYASRQDESCDDHSVSGKQDNSDGEDTENILPMESHETNGPDILSSTGGNLPLTKEHLQESLASLDGNNSEGTESSDYSDLKNGKHSLECHSLESAGMPYTTAESPASRTTPSTSHDTDSSTVLRSGTEVANSNSGETQEDVIISKENLNGDKATNGVDRSRQEIELKENISWEDISSVPNKYKSGIPEIHITTVVQHSRQDLSKTNEVSDADCMDENGKSFQCALKQANTLQTQTASDLNNEQKSVFCEDNNESIAMECESLDSDHNESEISQPMEINKTDESKCNLESSIETEEPKSESTECKHVNEDNTNDTSKKETRTRKSRFHSPSTTWSPRKTDVKDRQRSRSRSKGRDSPGRRKSRSRSRDRDGNREHGGQWKGRSRERRYRRQSRSKSRSRSRSRSPSRTARSRCGGPDRNEGDCGSPSWKERRQYDNWKSPRGNERYKRNDQDKSNENLRRERHDTNRERHDVKDSSEQYQENKSQNEYPDWVVEKMKSSDARGKGGNRSGVSPRGSHRDSNHSPGDSWSKSPGMDWKSPRGRGGRGRAGVRGGFADGENRWNNWQPFSGNSNSSGQDSTRFSEQKNYRPKYDQEQFDSPADRSGWSSASSWAVRKTLPADVQNYYSKRGRTSSGSQSTWPKQEEPQDQAIKTDQPTQDQANQQTESPHMPLNMVPGQMNVVPQQINPPPQAMNMFPYSVAVPPPPLVNMQHNPYNIHAQLPMHIHPGIPLVQVSGPTNVSQGLPPPPPPPPPSQQVNYVALQQEGKQLQKLQIQEKAANEVKMAIKQYYQNKDITKDEYKEIVKKAVDKVCHSKSGEVDSAKVANLVKAYVDKYKHSRKKGMEEK